MALFEDHSLEEHTQAVADYVPQGKLWRAKNIVNSKIRDLLTAFGASNKRQEEALNDFWQEVFIGTTDEFIDDFEKALGIPDDCFTGTGTLEERRTQAQLKLVSLYVVTEQDFIDLAAILGFTITIEQPIKTAIFPYVFPFVLPDAKGIRFTWIVRGVNVATAGFPYIFPFVFPDLSNQNILQCLFNRLKPANTSLQFLNS